MFQQISSNCTACHLFGVPRGVPRIEIDMATANYISTDKEVKNLKPEDGKDRVERPITNNQLEGLRIIAYESGKKRFFYRYKKKAVGKASFIKATIGYYPEKSLSEARKIHAELVEKWREGIDPQLYLEQKKKQNIEALTFADVAALYFQNVLLPRKLEKEKLRGRPSKDEVAAFALLENHVFPHVGHWKIKDIQKTDITDILEIFIKEDKRAAGRNTLSQIKQVFRYAVEKGVLTDYDVLPVLSIKRGYVWKKRKKKITATLDQIKQFLSVIDDLGISVPASLALKVLIYTGKRATETLLTERKHIDFEKRIWTIPPENQKDNTNATEEREPDEVYITDSLERIFKELMEISPTEYLFQSPVKSAPAPITHDILSQALLRKKEQLDFLPDGFTPHKWRATMTTALQNTGMSPRITERLTSHSNSETKASDAEEYYNFATYPEQKKAAWIKWESMINSTNEPDNTKRPDNVIQFKKRA